MLDRTKEPGAPGEPLYQDVVTALAEEIAAGRAPVRGRHAARDRRTLRPVVEGVHAGDGQGGARRARRPRSPKNHFTVGIVDDVTRTEPAGRSGLRHRARRRRARGLLRPRQRRHGQREQELDQDHRRAHRPARAGLLRLRLEEGGRGHRLAPAVRAAPDPLHLPDPRRRTSSPATSSSGSSAPTCSSVAAPGATFLLNSPFGPDEVWEHLPEQTRRQHRRQGSCGSSWSTATRWRRRPGSARASTPCCRPASSRSPTSCRSTRRSRAIKDAIVKTYGKRGETVLTRNFAAVDGALAALHEVAGPGRGRRGSGDAARRCPRTRRTSSSA